MTDRASLIALAERCEAAIGPDRELDALIYFSTTAKWSGRIPSWPPTSIEDRGALDTGYMVIQGSGYFYGDIVPAYCASLDAAMTLVPEGWHLQLSDWSEPALCELGPWMAILSPPGIRTGMETIIFRTRCQHAATPALALCAASLRAAGEQTP